MKRFMVGVLGGALLISTGVFAQDQTTGTGSTQDQQQKEQKWGGHHGRKMKDPQARLDHMSKVLNLTDDQKAKIKPILDSEAQQMQSLKSDTSSAQQDRRAKMMEIHKSSMDQIRPILNSDQQAKLDQQIQKMKEHRAKHGGQQKSGTSAPPQS
jgi:periplasmic protein CpxP/Spy